MQPSGTSTHGPWWELLLQFIAVAPILYLVLLFVFNDGHPIKWRGRFTRFSRSNEINPPRMMREERAGYVTAKVERFQKRA